MHLDYTTSTTATIYDEYYRTHYSLLSITNTYRVNRFDVFVIESVFVMIIATNIRTKSCPNCVTFACPRTDCFAPYNARNGVTKRDPFESITTRDPLQAESRVNRFSVFVIESVFVMKVFTRS